MRGKVSDNDLTNYALNELPPDERLYVESMLAVSEECRGDVYQMLEMGEMLKEGFEADESADESGAELLLSEEQRLKVLTVPRWNWRGLLRQAAAITLLAAGTAYTLTRPGFWKEGGAADKIAVAGDAARNFIAEVSDKGLARTAQEFTERLQAISGDKISTENPDLQYVAMPAVCTPPIATAPVAEM